jgi:hypothetical protein
MTTQYNYTFGNIEITQTVIIGKSGILKINEVSIFNGEYFELINQSHPDYKKAIILMHNAKISE